MATSALSGAEPTRSPLEWLAKSRSVVPTIFAIALLLRVVLILILPQRPGGHRRAESEDAPAEA